MRNDPLIKELSKKYPAPMPNLGLSDAEVDDIIAYLQKMDESGSKSPQSGHHMMMDHGMMGH